ncbi:hypothetical protein J2Z21_009485 [Streptomyces griseochromogenes]|uniref:Uncharacterized protein n=1 Tax=Streptomyces griseochromogenes TaxID=68214 RepID=A0A1B1B065_9ACTN|nr:hypothetical protein [Streptomyces griseochromogenes]ANP52197.1 hypothetical protein AVL59_23930 [Streptomyces griseochromogenes]MBP2056467.1 hypothetical protein [Streptomyces griseochromogenes]
MSGTCRASRSTWWNRDRDTLMALHVDLSVTQSVPVANLNCDDLSFDIAVYEILAQNAGLNGAAAAGSASRGRRQLNS